MTEIIEGYCENCGVLVTMCITDGNVIANGMIYPQSLKVIYDKCMWK